MLALLLHRVEIQRLGALRDDKVALIEQVRSQLPDGHDAAITAVLAWEHARLGRLEAAHTLLDDFAAAKRRYLEIECACEVKCLDVPHPRERKLVFRPVAAHDQRDFIVVGAGAAGSSVAYELSKHGRVALVERESAPAYHSTSRSAAVLAENYGPVGWQRLSSASRDFFEHPPEGFAEHRLLRPLGALFFATAEEAPILEESARELSRRGVAHRLMKPQDAQALSPTLLPLD